MLVNPRAGEEALAPERRGSDHYLLWRGRELGYDTDHRKNRHNAGSFYGAGEETLGTPDRVAVRESLALDNY